MQLSASLTDSNSSRAEMHMNESLNTLVAWLNSPQSPMSRWVVQMCYLKQSRRALPV